MQQTHVQGLGSKTLRTGDLYRLLRGLSILISRSLGAQKLYKGNASTAPPGQTWLLVTDRDQCVSMALVKALLLMPQLLRLLLLLLLLTWHVHQSKRNQAVLARLQPGVLMP